MAVRAYGLRSDGSWTERVLSPVEEDELQVVLACFARKPLDVRFGFGFNEVNRFQRRTEQVMRGRRLVENARGVR